MSITSTLAGLLRTKAKGTTAAGALTSKPIDANTQSLHVSVADALPVGANTIGNIKITDGTNIGAVKAASTPALSTDAAQVVVISPNNSVAVSLAMSNADIHGQLVSVSRVTQISTKFFQQSPQNFLNITSIGTGTATSGTGTALFSSGTGVTSQVFAQTPVTINYASQYEAWSVQSASFTAPTSTASYQRIGLYNSLDGFSFGYNGLIFGVWTRFNSVDTFVAQTSWNKDVLNGATNSLFTSSNTPVALVPTNMNMFRIRYGWYGATDTFFEVYAPDGHWVIVHQVRTANSQVAVNLTNPNLPLTVDVSKTASDATNLVVSCGGWAAGTTIPTSGPTVTGQVAIGSLNASLILPLTGLASLSFTITGVWVGTIAFQYSLDGINFTPDAALDTVLGVFTTQTSANNNYTATVPSFKYYRLILTSYTSGTANIVYNSGVNANFITTQTLLTDSSNNGPSAVKPAGITAVAADPALVVALSPNSNSVTVTSQPEVVTSGTITTTDIAVSAPSGIGVFVSGTSTAGSYLFLNASGGNASVIVEVTGLTSGTLWYEGSADSTTGIDGNWVSLNLKQTGIVNTQITQSITINGMFRGNTAGIKYVRVRSVGTLVGTPTVYLRLSSGVAGLFLFGSIPTGTNTIGAVTITDGSKSLALGNQLSSVSVPVAMAADQFLINDTSTNKDLLTQLLIEMRVMNLILHSTLQSRDDLDSLRIDAQSTIDKT